MPGLGPSLGRPIRMSEPLLQLGQLLIHQGGGPVGRQLTLFGRDEPANQGGRGLGDLLCRSPDTLNQPTGPLQHRVGLIAEPALGTLNRGRPQPVLGCGHPILLGHVPILGRRRRVRRRPLILRGGRPLLCRQGPTRRLAPIRGVQLPVDDRLLILTALPSLCGLLPLVRRQLPTLGLVISCRGRPVPLQGALLPLVGHLFPVAGQLVPPRTGAVALGGQVVIGCRVLVALVGRPVLPLGRLLPVRERPISTHRPRSW